MSGNFDGASDIILVNKGNRVLVKNACILANRHVHCKSSELVKYGWYDGKVLSVKVDGIRGGILENVIVKSKDSYNLELHLDTDEANAFYLIMEMKQRFWRKKMETKEIINLVNDLKNELDSLGRSL